MRSACMEERSWWALRSGHCIPNHSNHFRICDEGNGRRGNSTWTCNLSHSNRTFFQSKDWLRGLERRCIRLAHVLSDSMSSVPVRKEGWMNGGGAVRSASMVG
jgi:hypothetical protein